MAFQEGERKGKAVANSRVSGITGSRSRSDMREDADEVTKTLTRFSISPLEK